MEFLTFVVLFLITLALMLILISVNKTNPTDSNAIKSIVRGSSRYALASLQDRSPMIALLHANYGAGYFWAMRDAFNSKDIENATGINILDYEKKITDIQDKSTKEVIKVCPQFATNVDLSLAKIANELN
jgi:hypothetical protein